MEEIHGVEGRKGDKGKGDKKGGMGKGDTGKGNSAKGKGKDTGNDEETWGQWRWREAFFFILFKMWSRFCSSFLGQGV